MTAVADLEGKLVNAGDHTVCARRTLAQHFRFAENFRQGPGLKIDYQNQESMGSRPTYQEISLFALCRSPRLGSHKLIDIALD